MVQFRDEFAEVFVVFSPDHNQEAVRPLVSNELSLAAQEVCLAPAGNDCSLLALALRWRGTASARSTASEHLAQRFYNFLRIGSLQGNEFRDDLVRFMVDDFQQGKSLADNRSLIGDHQCGGIGDGNKRSVGIELHHTLQNRDGFLRGEELQRFVEADDLVAICRQFRFLAVEGQAFAAWRSAGTQDLDGLCVNRDEGVSVEQEGAFDERDRLTARDLIGHHDRDLGSLEVGVPDDPFAGQFFVEGKDVQNRCVRELHRDIFGGWSCRLLGR